jgi:hypothetical protein
MNFAPSYATLTAMLAESDCATSSWTTATSAACIGIRGLGLVGTAGITAAGLVGTSSILFSFDGCMFVLSTSFWSDQDMAFRYATPFHYSSSYSDRVVAVQCGVCLGQRHADGHELCSSVRNADCRACIC